MATIENISATNMRVNLTDIIDELSVDKAVAVTKHKKVIAYVLSPETYNSLMGIEEEVAIDPDPAEEARKSRFQEILDEEEVEVDAGELACETTAGPNYEPDPVLDGDFDSFLEELQNETLDKLKSAG